MDIVEPNWIRDIFDAIRSAIGGLINNIWRWIKERLTAIIIILSIVVIILFVLFLQDYDLTKAFRVLDYWSLG